MLSPRSRVLMLFLDGVGIGRSDPRSNPFFAASYPTLLDLCGGNMIHIGDSRRNLRQSSLKPINATMGVGGLPQSGTGQTALLTGVNAAKVVGKHFGPYPYSTLRPIIDEQNIFRRLRDRDRKSYYANAFPQRYFEYMHTRKSRMSAMAMSWVSSGYALNTAAVLAEGKALSADITSERWNKQGFPPVPALSPEEAGKRLVSLTEEYDFVLFEFYLTDHAGHSQSMKEGIEVLTLIDRFMGGILAALPHESTTFIMTSDHGNLEDVSTKSHTRHAVPFLAVGRHHKAIAENVNDLMDVPSAILEMLN